jgi:hypothetical protein
MVKKMPRYYFQTVVARKTVNGITVGYLVGWKSHWHNFVRNIRADLYFNSENEARRFQTQLEKERKPMYAEFEVLDSD